MAVDEIKFGAPLAGVFEWPEEPAGAVLDQMIYYLAACAVATRGDDPGYANEARISSIVVKLGTKAAN
jgi:hypothetical protein